MDLSKELHLLRAPVVLLCGETGCGKGYFAQQIFTASSVSKDSFMTVHLAALNESLLESELFGHEKGAFTGAVNAKKGYVEKCGFGTLFLDEIGELSLEAQKKLLYLLEERCFSPVGSTQQKKFNGRVIAATNRHLPDLVKQGKFREDLFYRLMLAQYTIAPLRQRPDAILPLIEQINQQMARQYQRPPLRLGEDFVHWAKRYSWPGNIRELKNVLEYFFLRDEVWLKSEKLPPWVAAAGACQTNSQERQSMDYTISLEHFEGQFFRKALEVFEGRVNETARQVGISKSTLIAKIRKYGINTWEIRSRCFAQGFA